MQNGVGDIYQSVPRNIEEYRSRKDPEAMKAVAKEMEALFAQEMIKVMRETTDMSSEGTLGKNTYMSLFDTELSKLFAQRGLGLQDMLLKGMKNIAEKAGSAPKLHGAHEDPVSTEK
jgi:Rod binding domain-containing protein